MAKSASAAKQRTTRAVGYPFTRLGLTGGIASGKTTVLEMMRRLGAETIDTDAIAHEVLEKDGAVRRALVDAFGRKILDPNGCINRSRLGDIVFRDDRSRLRLNRIIHPAIRRRWTAEAAALAHLGFSGVVAVAIPLLYEAGAQNLFDIVVVAGCTEQTQIQRLRQRGLTESQARQRIAAQMPLQEKMARSDRVIWNESPLPVLEQQVRLIWKELARARL